MKDVRDGSTVAGATRFLLVCRPRFPLLTSPAASQQNAFNLHGFGCKDIIEASDCKLVI